MSIKKPEKWVRSFNDTKFADKWLTIEPDLYRFADRFKDCPDVQRMLKALICGWRNSASPLNEDLQKLLKTGLYCKFKVERITDAFNHHPITPVLRNHLDAMGIEPPRCFQTFRCATLRKYGKPLVEAYPLQRASDTPTKEQREFIECIMKDIDDRSRVGGLTLKDLARRTGYRAGHTKYLDYRREKNQ